MKGEVAAGDKAVGVNAGKEASQVLVVNEWGGLSVKVPLFQKLDEFEHVAFGQVVWESRRDKLVDELRDAIQHGSKRG